MNLPRKNMAVRVNAQTHFKRLGRELAMQYLYLRDMTPETDTAEDVEKAREMFWEQAAEGDLTSDDRVFKKAKNYAEKMIDGVLFYLNEIDGVLESFSEKWDIKRMAAVDRNIIRIAVYELKYCPEIPILVSIDEAIEISKSYATEKSGVFINGILNGVKDSLPPDAKDKGIE
ncbi:MAG: transcription antitermination factor NusB [Lentisphaeria bacterium]|nr:transcription antitermination factor NusB [Lentisphaeria bacterium]